MNIEEITEKIKSGIFISEEEEEYYLINAIGMSVKEAKRIIAFSITKL